MAFEAFLSDTQARPRRLRLFGYLMSLALHVPPVALFVFFWLTHHVLIGHAGDPASAAGARRSYWVPIVTFSDPAGGGRGLGFGAGAASSAAGVGVGRFGGPGAVGGLRIRRTRPLNQPHAVAAVSKKGTDGPILEELAAFDELTVEGHETGTIPALADPGGTGLASGDALVAGVGSGGAFHSGSGTGAGDSGAGLGALGESGRGGGGAEGEQRGAGIAVALVPKAPRVRGEKGGDKEGPSAGTVDGAFGVGALDGPGVDMASLGAQLPTSVRSPVISDKVAAYFRTYEDYPRMPEAYWGVRTSMPLLLYVCVSAEGAVSEVVVRKGVDPDVDRLVTDTVRSWRYRPRIVSGLPHPFCHPIRIEYAKESRFSR